MKQFFVIILVALSLNVFAQTNNVGNQNYIEVTGKSELEIVPDEIYLQIILNEDDFKNKMTLPKMEKLMFEKLQKLGIDLSKDLSISDFASNFQNYWIKPNQINSTKVYQLLVHSASVAGSVFQELESVGISNISISRINHSDMAQYRKQTGVLAMKAAQQKALILTEAINQKCGSAIYIEEQTPFQPYVNRSQASNIMFNVKATASDNTPEINFEKIKVESVVLVRFELK